MNPEQVLNNTYQIAFEAVNKNDILITQSFSEEQMTWLDIVTTSPEKRKGVLTVLITSLVKKIITPSQDVRQHQENLPRGYSGRTLDTKWITPFMRKNGFPAMAESGWLTRSLEQNHPYDQNYSGKITPVPLKIAFLNILEDVQQHPENAQPYLTYLFMKLEQFKQAQKHNQIVRLPEEIANQLSISTILEYLNQHFTASYPPNLSGAARLPVLALHAVYNCLISEVTRYLDKVLLPLQNHTTADSKSRSIGDIEVVEFTINQELQPFEGVEVKFGIPITLEIVRIAYSKISAVPVQRYYILSTAEIKEEERSSIVELIKLIRAEHGCEMVVNGVMPSLKYYLRLITNVGRFLEYYAENLANDTSIKSVHRSKWNDIIQAVKLA